MEIVIDYGFSLIDLEYFLLILTRITCFIYIAPFFGMNNTPGRVKIGLGFFISVLVYYLLTPKQYPDYSGVFGYSMLVAKEAATGLIIGLGAQICLSITNFAGRMVDMEIGLAMVNQLDPTTKENSTISGIYYQYFTMILLIITGMYHYLIRALVESFQLIPVSGAIFRYENLLENMLSFLRDYLVIGFKICLPVFATIMLLNVVLGILAKVAPQMNMFAVGMQLKIIVGLTILFISCSLLPMGVDMIFEEMKVVIVSFVKSIMPQ